MRSLVRLSHRPAVFAWLIGKSAESTWQCDEHHGMPLTIRVMQIVGVRSTPPAQNEPSELAARLRPGDTP